MRKFLIIILILVSAFAARGEGLPVRFIHAIHLAETGGRLGDIKGDYMHGVPHSRGPFQISLHYWRDSGVNLPYSKAADYNSSVRVVNAYLNRFAPQAVKSGDFETLARVHNGGPDGVNNPRTAKYWRRVRAALK